MKTKNIFFICAATLASLSFSGCTDDITYDTGAGEGRILLGATLNNDVKATSRAAVTDDALAANTLIWISNSKGVVRKYNGISEIPANGIWLTCDNYIAEAWAGDSVPAAFDKKYFKGRESFSITNGQTMQVDIECMIANVVVEIRYDDAIDNALSDYTVTVSHQAGSLTYGDRNSGQKTGYFMMPSFDKDLAYTLAGKTADGGDVSFSGTIANAKPATKYVINVKYNPTTGENPEIGAGQISIEVDETEILIEDRVEIVAAPVITALNFESDKPVTGEPGKLTEKKLWIQSTSPLKTVQIDCSSFNEALGIKPMIELLGMDPSFEATLETKGFTKIHIQHKGEELNPDFEEMKLVFADAFLNVIPEGEHAITITATDSNGLTTTTVINLVLTDAPVLPVETPADAPTTWATSITLTGTVLKTDAANVGFNYREQGTQQWETILYNESQQARSRVAPRALEVGSTYSVVINGLKPGTTYEYQAICDGFTSAISTTTTEAGRQLENAGFENWSSSTKPQLVYADGGEMFWDSGNHGSKMAGIDLTTPDSSIKHSGNYSAKLASQKASVMGIGKFAAGNIFVGKYIKTEGTDGVLGFGRPFTSRPKALRGYVRYQPGTVEYTSSDYPSVQKGDTDKGIIYIAILDSEARETYNNEEWPFVVQTKKANRHLFDQATNTHVIAYGEKVFESATAGDGLIPFEIPLEYRHYDRKAANILIVCSASKAGDYFVGGNSTMWIDDFELVY